MALPSQADALSRTNIANAPIVGDTGGVVVGPPILTPNIEVRYLPPAGFDAKSAGVPSSQIPSGADPVKEQPAAPVFTNNTKSDLRVWLQVPPSYLTGVTSIKGSKSGVVFPYTPQISIEHKAEYTAQTPLHSNFALHFYKNSMIGDISIQGLFTVQNDQDAQHYLATVHLLRALTKGRFGGNDSWAGSPPPICRLHAYGAFMLDNAPVTVAAFKQELPFDVDYYYLSTQNSKTFGEAMVPTKCTITIICKPMFSRQEMLSNGSVPSWLSGGSRKGGML
jgi:hypothetical protein